VYPKVINFEEQRTKAGGFIVVNLRVIIYPVLGRLTQDD